MYLRTGTWHNICFNIGVHELEILRAQNNLCVKVSMTLCLNQYIPPNTRFLLLFVRTNIHVTQSTRWLFPEWTLPFNHSLYHFNSS